MFYEPINSQRQSHLYKENVFAFVNVKTKPACILSYGGMRTQRAHCPFKSPRVQEHRIIHA